MIEMTREEALKIVRENYPHFGTTEPWLDLEKALATLVPELRESEDERIRKEIYDFIFDGIWHDVIINEVKQKRKYEKWLIYLEKQKGILNKRGQEIIFNLCQNKIDGIQHELIEFLSNTVDASWVDIIKSADCYTERIRNIIEKQKERDLDIVPELRPTAWGEGYQHGCKDTEEKYAGMMVCSPEEWNEAIADAFKHGMDEGEKQKEHQNNSDAPNESSWSGMISSSHKDKNLDEIAQDYVDGVKEYNPEPTWDLMQTAVCYGYHYREQKEQKPEDRFEEAREKYQVEWSEEEAAETHVKNKYCLTKLLGAEIREAVLDFKAGAEWQKSQMPMPEDTVLFNKGVAEGRRLEREEKDLGWISVKDRLPEKDGWYFTCVEMSGVPQCVGLSHFETYSGQWDDDDDSIELVDYWMEIPALPKKEEK